MKSGEKLRTNTRRNMNNQSWDTWVHECWINMNAKSIRNWEKSGEKLRTNTRININAESWDTWVHEC